MDILSADFNILIEVTKSVLFSRNTKYPPTKVDSANVFRTELKRPEGNETLYEVSVSIFGPWENLPAAPTILTQAFQGFEKKALSLQRALNGSFVTMKSYRREPKPNNYQCVVKFNAKEWQWIVELEESWESDSQHEDMTELTFKTPCKIRIEDMCAETYKRFLDRTIFMFYDITFEFSYWGEPFQRTGIDLPVPWSASKKLKKFLRHKLGQAEHLGSAWFCHDVLTNEEDQAVDVTAVNYGIAGESTCLPVWLLGPSGIPMPNCSSTLYMQLVCQATEIPPDIVKDYVPPAGLPLPDFCLNLPPQHKLTKQTHFLVIAVLVPITHRKHLQHCRLMNQFDAVSAHHWPEVVETIVEAVYHGSDIKEESNEFKLCRGMATALGSIIRQSFNRDFREKCFKLLEVNNSIDAQDSIEEYLIDYLNEMHSRPKFQPYHLYHPPRDPLLPPKDSGYTNAEWKAMPEEEKTAILSRGCRIGEKQEQLREKRELQKKQREEERQEQASQSQHSSQEESCDEPVSKKHRLEEAEESEVEQESQEEVPASSDVEQSTSTSSQEILIPSDPCPELNDSFETQMISELTETPLPLEKGLQNSIIQKEESNNETPFIDFLFSGLE